MTSMHTLYIGPDRQTDRQTESQFCSRTSSPSFRLFRCARDLLHITYLPSRPILRVSNKQSRRRRAVSYLVTRHITFPGVQPFLYLIPEGPRIDTNERIVPIPRTSLASILIPSRPSALRKQAGVYNGYVTVRLRSIGTEPGRQIDRHARVDCLAKDLPTYPTVLENVGVGTGNTIRGVNYGVGGVGG